VDTLCNISLIVQSLLQDWGKDRGIIKLVVKPKKEHGHAALGVFQLDLQDALFDASLRRMGKNNVGSFMPLGSGRYRGGAPGGLSVIRLPESGVAVIWICLLVTTG